MHSVQPMIKKIAQLTGHEASIFALCTDGQDNHFLSGAGDGWIVRWNLNDPEMGRLIAKVETQIFSLLSLPERQQLVVGNMNGGVHWITLNHPDKTKNIAHHQKGTFGICRVGPKVFTIGGGGTLTKWDIEAARSEESLQLSNQSLRAIDFCPERNELAVGSSDNGIYLVNATTLALKKVLPQAHENSVFAVRYSPDGNYLLSGSRDAHLKAWSLDEDYQCISSQPAHWFTINDIQYHPQGHCFATGSRDKTIKIWDSRSFELLKVIETVRDQGHINSVNCLHWSAYHNQLISGGDDRSMIVWRLGDD